MIYTCYHAYSAAVDKREVSDEPFVNPQEGTETYSYTVGTSEKPEVINRRWGEKSISRD